jgi:hypothetical protein
LLPFAIKHPEPTAQGKQRHPKLKFQHSSGHSLADICRSGACELRRTIGVDGPSSFHAREMATFLMSKWDSAA